MRGNKHWKERATDTKTLFLDQNVYVVVEREREREREREVV